MKKCCKCKSFKKSSDFNKCSGRKDGLQTKCRVCDNSYTRSYQQTNWKAQKIYQLTFQKENYTKNLNYRLSRVLRNRIRSALIKAEKVGSAILDLGCSVRELRLHLESKFKDGMSWENYGLHGWHIDHIKPLASFDLSDPEQFKQACHYTNLQPLWASDNLIKGARSMVK